MLIFVDDVKQSLNINTLLLVYVSAICTIGFVILLVLMRWVGRKLEVARAILELAKAHGIASDVVLDKATRAAVDTSTALRQVQEKVEKAGQAVVIEATESPTVTVRTDHPPEKKS